jgi:hypothetical protein
LASSDGDGTTPPKCPPRPPAPFKTRGGGNPCGDRTVVAQPAALSAGRGPRPGACQQLGSQAPCHLRAIRDGRLRLLVVTRGRSGRTDLHPPLRVRDGTNGKERGHFDPCLRQSCSYGQRPRQPPRAPEELLLRTVPLYVKAGPAGGRGPPSGRAGTRRSPRNSLTLNARQPRRAAQPWLSSTAQGSYCPRCAGQLSVEITFETDTAKRPGLGSLRATPTRGTRRTAPAATAKKAVAVVGHSGWRPARAHRGCASPRSLPTLGDNSRPARSARGGSPDHGHHLHFAQERPGWDGDD